VLRACAQTRHVFDVALLNKLRLSSLTFLESVCCSSSSRVTNPLKSIGNPTRSSKRDSSRSWLHKLKTYDTQKQHCVWLGDMAGAFEQPLFFSSAMITTSSRLQHLDSHFSLHTRLSGCRQATPKPQVDCIQPSPPLLLSPPPQIVKRSTSRSSKSSDAASFHSAASNAEDVDAREEKTACLPSQKQKTAAVPENVEPEVTTKTEANAPTGTSSSPIPYPASIPVLGPLKALPEQSRPRSRKEATHRALERRRTSTVSEPLPRLSIPRRTSSAVHRRQRKGQDLISFHRDSCRLFQSLEGTLSANHEESRPICGRHHSMPGIPSVSFSDSLDPPEIQHRKKLLEGHSEDQASANAVTEIPSYVASTTSLPVQVEIEDTPSPTGLTATTVMSWTTAETRKREYQKIDQAHSGFRGLWKKLTPKWCHGRNSRRKFFEGKCDGDSVRRYRLEVPIQFGSANGTLTTQKAH
jgi:hypothetical protein